MTSEPIPRPFVVLAGVAAALFLLPLVGLLVRFPFADAVGALTSLAATSSSSSRRRAFPPESTH